MPRRRKVTQLGGSVARRWVAEIIEVTVAVRFRDRHA